jgi:Zn-dependent protease with chaperone function
MLSSWVPWCARFLGLPSSEAIQPWWYAAIVVGLVSASFGIAARWLEVIRIQFVADRLNLPTGNDPNENDASGGIDMPRTSPPTIPWWLRKRQSVLLWCWCLFQPICLAASGWSPVVDQFIPVDNGRLFHLVAIILPSLVVLYAMERGRFIGNQCTGVPPGCTATKQGGISFAKQLRSNAGGTWVFPIGMALLVASLADGTQLIADRFPSVGVSGAILFAIGTSFVLTLLTPHLFAWLIHAQPADEAVVRLAQDVWSYGSSRMPEVLLWPTGGRVANAAMIGMMGNGRKLLLTDGLLQRLSDQEIKMVILHELAHCIRLHAWIRILPTLVTVCALWIAMTFLQGIVLSVGCFVLLAGFLLSLVAVCWYTEFDADRFAVRLATVANQTDATENVEALKSALIKIYGIDHQKRSSWMHPSCARRIAGIDSYNVLILGSKSSIPFLELSLKR